jgi:hypothetical protein
MPRLASRCGSTRGTFLRIEVCVYLVDCAAGRLMGQEPRPHFYCLLEGHWSAVFTTRPLRAVSSVLPIGHFVSLKHEAPDLSGAWWLVVGALMRLA